MRTSNAFGTSLAKRTNVARRIRVSSANRLSDRRCPSCLTRSAASAIVQSRRAVSRFPQIATYPAHLLVSRGLEPLAHDDAALAVAERGVQPARDLVAGED